MSRDWAEARAKVELEGRCRVCRRPLDPLLGETYRIEAAHIIDRALGAGQDSSLIAPLCGPVTDTGTCHGKFDSHSLDLLPYLTLDEQVAAVRAAGGIERARNRLIGPSRNLSPEQGAAIRRYRGEGSE